MAKAIFVFNNGKTFTARNIHELNPIIRGGNIVAIKYTRACSLEKAAFSGATPEHGLFIKGEVCPIWNEGSQSITVKVDKAGLSYVILEDYTETVDFVEHSRQTVSIIPCLEKLTPEMVRDLIK